MYPGVESSSGGLCPDPAMSPDSRARTPTVIPAWPALVAVQATVAVSLLCFGLIEAPPWRWRGAPPPIEQRLERLDLPAAEAALGAALLQARSPSAVLRPGHGAAGESVVQLGALVGLDVSSVSWGAAVAVGPIEEQPVALLVHGDPYDLPALLSLLERWPVDVQLRGVSASGSGTEDVELRLDLAFSRPAALHTDWMDDRLLRATPAAAAAGPVLERAADLARWRQYNAALEPRGAEAEETTRQALRDLSPLLVRLRREGGRLDWRPGSPPTLR